MLIARFTNRNFCQRIPEKRKNEVNLVDIGCPAGSSIYFNENLSLQCKSIWIKARMLKKEKLLLLYVWTDKGVIRIKRDLTS